MAANACLAGWGWEQADEFAQEPEIA